MPNPRSSPARRPSGVARPLPRLRPGVEACEPRLLMSHAPHRVAVAAHAAHVSAAAKKAAVPKNVLIFVADGLRPGSINATDTPTMNALRKLGVNFVNSHAIFPTFTTPNSAAIATGHYPGDTGDFSNTVFAGYPVTPAGSSQTPFLESDAVLQDVDEHFGGNFLGEESLLAFARAKGYNTAAIGKLGPVLIQDVTQNNLQNGAVPPPQTVIIDDSTGKAGGVPLSSDVQSRLQAAGLPIVAPDRTNGASSTSQQSNGFSGSNTAPGTLAANVNQQQFFADAATKAVLPSFVASGRPFAMVYWSRDPDGSQHNQGDSLNSLTPGINGPTSRAGVHNADSNLAQILAFLNANKALAKNTDIFVTADHGFSTISRNAADASGGTISDYASTQTYAGVNPGFLPVGFVAIDIAHELNLSLFDPDTTVTNNGVKTYAPVDAAKGQKPRSGDGLIGGTGAIQGNDAQVVVAANGGSDLIYVPGRDPATVKRIADFLAQQGYTSGVFVDDAFGSIPGTLPLSSINLKGTAQLPTPAIVLNFRTFSTDAANPLNTGVEVADSGLQQGQGMHGSFGRQDTFNTMIAFGPDFKKRFTDKSPVSNADIALTLAKALRLKVPAGNGNLTGRAIGEALVRGPRTVKTKKGVLASAAGPNGQITYLNFQAVGKTKYFDAAGYAGRTVGLVTSTAKAKGPKGG